MMCRFCAGLSGSAASLSDAASPAANLWSAGREGTRTPQYCIYSLGLRVSFLRFANPDTDACVLCRVLVLDVLRGKGNGLCVCHRGPTGVKRPPFFMFAPTPIEGGVRGGTLLFRHRGRVCASQVAAGLRS